MDMDRKIFVVETLLFGLLLQSCSGPGLKITDDTLTKSASTKINHLTEVTQRMVLSSGEKSLEDSLNPKVGGALVLGDEALGKDSVEAPNEVSSKASDAAARIQEEQTRTRSAQNKAQRNTPPRRGTQTERMEKS